MSLSGTFATMPFPDLAQWIGEARRTGTLMLKLDTEDRYVRIESGDVTALGSDDPRSCDLVRLLVARGLLDRTTVPKILAEHHKGERPLRQLLIDDGYIDRSALSVATRTHAKTLLLQVFVADQGGFVFTGDAERGLLDDVAWEMEVTPALPLREVLMDGMRRLDEWQRVTEALPSDYTLIHGVAAAPDLPAVQALFEMGEPVALGQFLLQFERPRFEVLEELYQGWQRGVVAVEARPQELAGPDSDASTMLLESARTLLEEQQFDEASALLRSLLSLDPMNEAARRLLRRTRDDQIEALYREFPPYRVPRLRVSRDQAAAMALSPREKFLLTRVDGQRDVAMLSVVTPLGELETLRALKKFQRLGLITWV